MTPQELVTRLRQRAETSRNNARTYLASGYRGDAFACEERARAFDLAAEDALEVAETERRCVHDIARDFVRGVP
jgi:hypothetical protein